MWMLKVMNEWMIMEKYTLPRILLKHFLSFQTHLSHPLSCLYDIKIWYGCFPEPSNGKVGSKAVMVSPHLPALLELALGNFELVRRSIMKRTHSNVILCYNKFPYLNTPFKKFYHNVHLAAYSIFCDLDLSPPSGCGEQSLNYFLWATEGGIQTKGKMWK